MPINNLRHNQLSWIILGISTAIVVLILQVDGLSQVRSQLDASDYNICGGGTHDAGSFIPAYCSGHDGLRTNHSRNTRYNSSSNRIAGGQYASRGDFPSYARVNIYWNGKIGGYCAGTIIHRNLVLSAAHCWTIVLANLQAVGLTIEHTEVMVGGVNERHGNWQRIRVEKVCLHPFHVKYLVENRLDYLVYDAAILLLERDIEYNRYTRPACIETGIGHREQATCYIVGMGNLDQTGATDGRVKYVEMKRNCFHGPNGPIYEEEERRVFGSACYKAPEYGTSCHGDSGGPMICMEDCNGSGPLQFVAGPVSYGSLYDYNEQRIPPICSSRDNFTANFIADVSRLVEDDGWNNMLECAHSGSRSTNKRVVDVEPLDIVD